MVEPVHQRLVSAVKARFETIRKERGYLTDIGANVFLWRATEIPVGQLPCVNLIDLRGETEAQISGRNDHHRWIEFLVEAQSLAMESENIEGETGVEADRMGRYMLADIERCLGNDFRESTEQLQKLWAGRWKENTADSTGLAFMTLPSSDVREGGATWTMAVTQKDESIIHVTYRFKVNLRTPRWDAFTASN